MPVANFSRIVLYFVFLPYSLHGLWHGRQSVLMSREHIQKCEYRINHQGAGLSRNSSRFSVETSNSIPRHVHPATEAVVDVMGQKSKCLHLQILQIVVGLRQPLQRFCQYPFHPCTTHRVEFEIDSSHSLQCFQFLKNGSYRIVAFVQQR
jgi:hypothetical protein